MSIETNTQVSSYIGVQIRVPAWDDEVAWETVFAVDRNPTTGTFSHYDSLVGDSVDLSEDEAIARANAKRVELLEHYVNVRVLTSTTTITVETEVL